MDLFEALIKPDERVATIEYDGRKITLPRTDMRGERLFGIAEVYQFVTDGKLFVTMVQRVQHSTIVAFEVDEKGNADVVSITHVGNQETGAKLVQAMFPPPPPPPEKPKPLPVNGEEDAYLDLLRHVLVNGERRFDRTGVGTLSVFAPTPLKFSLRDGRFPLMTTKKLHTKSIFEELFWFLRGETNNNSLREKGVTIWDEWAREDGDLGPVYGYQWRHWPKLEKLQNLPGHDDAYVARSGVDQIEEVVHSLKTNPHGRRHIVSAWNPGMIHDMALPPCHVLFQFYVDNEDGLHCQMYQRSADLFLGVPFNIASYALLTHIVAVRCDLKAASLTMNFGDAHVYTNHFDQVRLQTSREARDFPRVKISKDVKVLPWDSLKLDDVKIEGYSSAGAISAPVAK